MRLALILGGIVVLAGFGFTTYIRTVPSDPDTWHVDPRSVDRVQLRGSYLLCDRQGDAPAHRSAQSPLDVMKQLDHIVLSSPRTTRLAGDPSAGHVTYVARSFLFGFPDYVSVMAYPDGEETAVAIYARLRFGNSDMGVNRRRVEGWLSQLG